MRRSGGIYGRFFFVIFNPSTDDVSETLSAGDVTAGDVGSVCCVSTDGRESDKVTDLGEDIPSDVFELVDNAADRLWRSTGEAFGLENMRGERGDPGGLEPIAMLSCNASSGD